MLIARFVKINGTLSKEFNGLTNNVHGLTNNVHDLINVTGPAIIGHVGT